MSDRELVCGILDGSVDYAAFVRRYEDSVYQWSFRLVRNEADAEELRQRTFIRAFDRLGQYDPARGSIATWLYRVCRSVGLNFLRQRAAGPLYLADLPEGCASVGLGGAQDSGAERAALWQAVDSLPPNQRRALLARVLGRLPWREVAESVGCCERNARRLVESSLGTLRQAVAAGAGASGSSVYSYEDQ